MTANRKAAWSLGAAGPLLAALSDGGPRDWRDQASCAEIGGDAWFPEPGGAVTAAKKICRACPVQTECLEYALEAGEQFGIFGGLSPLERRHLRHGMREAA